jgi:hypothetical protein
VFSRNSGNSRNKKGCFYDEDNSTPLFLEYGIILSASETWLLGYRYRYGLFHFIGQADEICHSKEDEIPEKARHPKTG